MTGVPKRTHRWPRSLALVGGVITPRFCVARPYSGNRGGGRTTFFCRYFLPFVFSLLFFQALTVYILKQTTYIALYCFSFDIWDLCFFLSSSFFIILFVHVCLFCFVFSHVVYVLFDSKKHFFLCTIDIHGHIIVCSQLQSQKSHVQLVIPLLWIVAFVLVCCRHVYGTLIMVAELVL